MACLTSVDVEIGLQRCYLHMSIVGVRGAAGLISTGHAGARVQGPAGGGGNSLADQPHPNPNIYLLSVRCHTFTWLAQIRPVMVANDLVCSQLDVPCSLWLWRTQSQGGQDGVYIELIETRTAASSTTFPMPFIVRHAATWEAT